MSDHPAPKRQRLPWTAEQFEFITAMRERGRGGDFIAAALKERFGVDRSASTILYQCLRLGADVPPRFRQATPKFKPFTRNGHRVRPWKRKEDKILLEMKAKGERTTVIARALKRNSSSITNRLMTIARNEARKEARG